MTYHSYFTSARTSQIFHARKINMYQQVNTLAMGSVFKVIRVDVWLGNGNVGEVRRVVSAVSKSPDEKHES